MRLSILLCFVVVLRVDARFAVPVRCGGWGLSNAAAATATVAAGVATVVPRGGADDDVAHPQGTAVPAPTSPRSSVAVGWVRRTSSTMDDPSSSLQPHHQQTAMFYSSDRQVYTSNQLDQDSIETLAITSDVLLITIDSSTVSGWETLSESIVKGATRRRDAGFPKLAVLVVWTTTAAGAKEEDAWKDRILSERLVAPFTPDIVASLDIVSESEAETTYQHVISDLPSEVTVANQEEYKLMIQQVYKSLTEKDCEVTFDIAEASFFKASHDEDVVATDATSFEQQPESELPVTAGLDVQGVDQGLLAAAMETLETLEIQQQDVWLNSDAQVPLLQFGSVANSILNQASAAVKQAPQDVQDAILHKVAAELRVLYQNQLQSLREQYGRKYELVLDENPEDDQAQVEAAARITEGFRTAAQHAIPEQCREGQSLVDADFSYVSSLQGLVSDMMEATSMRQAGDDDVVDVEEEPTPAKWYKKLAARCLMVGVNYIQGWLAWQGIKRAAEQRDRDMPKFPLF